MTDTLVFNGFYFLVLLAPLGLYVRWHVRRDKRAREAMERGQIVSEGPRGQHPHIDVSDCIGCQSCTAACPEGDVLGMIGGKAAVIKPHRCIGHGLCADACPVGAIRLVTASPAVTAKLPYLSPELETSVPNLFIAGELGGLALIKNAVNQGRDCIDTIAGRCAGDRPVQVLDVIIVGAGPAGISASLRAIERGLRYVTIERDTLGGSVAKYPRQKLVMTSPVEFPLGGKLKKLQLTKESLLSLWSELCDREGFHVRLNQTVHSIERSADGVFTVRAGEDCYQSRAVILAMGRGGVPRKLGVPGEDLPKVMYRLIEADHYRNCRILVVGGGDSAVEAAVGLSLQPGNQVTLSYRGAEFTRIKERNATRLEEVQRKRKLRVLLRSTPVEFTPESAVLEVEGNAEELANDYVWIFAGGVAPDEFLRRAGIEFGPRDLTGEIVREASPATVR